MADPRSIARLARVARVVALLFFLLPWINVSCSTHGLDQLGDPGATAQPSPAKPVAGASGVQLAIGSFSFAGSVPLRSELGEIADSFVKPNLLIGGGALLILLSFAAGVFLTGARGAIAGMAGVALAAAASCYAVLFQIPAAVQGLFEARRGNEMGIEIQVEAAIGFYLCLAALVAAIVFDFLAMRGPAPRTEPSPSG